MDEQVRLYHEEQSREDRRGRAAKPPGPGHDGATENETEQEHRQSGSFDVAHPFQRFVFVEKMCRPDPLEVVPRKHHLPERRREVPLESVRPMGQGRDGLPEGRMLGVHTIIVNAADGPSRRGVSELVGRG